jgi:hypothetical protein
MENNIEIYGGHTEQTLSDTMSRIKAFQQLIRSQFTADHDYGIVPGASKPSLLKPGAEKIITLLGLTSDFAITDRVRDYVNGFVSYDFECHLYRHGELITKGYGTANCKETKYISRDAHTIENTIMKMAKKRALVDAALLVGSLSDIFTQDVDDMDDLQGNKAKDYKSQATDTSGCISQAQAKRMFGIAHGDADLVKTTIKAHGYEKSTDVKKIDYEKICAEIEAAEKPKDGAQP